MQTRLRLQMEHLAQPPPWFDAALNQALETALAPLYTRTAYAMVACRQNVPWHGCWCHQSSRFLQHPCCADPFAEIRKTHNIALRSHNLHARLGQPIVPLCNDKGKLPRVGLFPSTLDELVCWENCTSVDELLWDRVQQLVVLHYALKDEHGTPFPWVNFWGLGADDILIRERAAALRKHVMLQ